MREAPHPTGTPHTCVFATLRRSKRRRSGLSGAVSAGSNPVGGTVGGTSHEVVHDLGRGRKPVSPLAWRAHCRGAPGPAGGKLPRHAARGPRFRVIAVTCPVIV